MVSEVRDRPVGQRHRASFQLSHHNGERAWAAARFAPLGTRNAVASTYLAHFVLQARRTAETGSTAEISHETRSEATAKLEGPGRNL